eukprot:Gb_40136 [translate_table: standard]
MQRLCAIHNIPLCKWKVARDYFCAFCKTLPVEEILTIKIKPGWKKGTNITFPKKGNEQPNVVPADLIFVIDEKSHELYKRDGNDLVVTQKISLAESLTGYTVNWMILNGRKPSSQGTCESSLISNSQED